MAALSREDTMPQGLARALLEYCAVMLPT